MSVALHFKCKMILGNTPTVALSFIKFCINLPPFGFRPRFFIEVVALVAVAYSVVVTLSTMFVFGSSVFLFGFFFFCAATVSVVTVSVAVVAVVAVVAAGLGLAARFFGVDFISGAGAAVSLTAVAAFLTLDGIVEKNIKIKQQKWLFIIHHVCQTF
jgi:hypothetical protein